MSVQVENYTPGRVQTLTQGSKTTLVDALGETILSVPAGEIDPSILAMEAQIQERHRQSLK